MTDDLVRGDLTAERGPLMYLPLPQMSDVHTLRHMSYVVRTTSPTSVGASMRAVVMEADPDLPVGSVMTMDEVVLDSLGDPLFQTRVLGIFAVLATLLATVGVYGVIAYSVNERMREMGIRMALGARPRQVVAVTLGRAFNLVAPGLVVGVAAALGATRLIQASLYDVTPTDPGTYFGVALVLGLAAVLAAIGPARRAARINPVDVLAR